MLAGMGYKAGKLNIGGKALFGDFSRCSRNELKGQPREESSKCPKYFPHLAIPPEFLHCVKQGIPDIFMPSYNHSSLYGTHGLNFKK